MGGRECQPSRSLGECKIVELSMIICKMKIALL